MGTNEQLEAKPAKLFRNGGSDGLRLPAGVVESVFREAPTVYVTAYPDTHTVVVSDQPGSATWGSFFALRDGIEIPAEYMADRPTNAISPRGGLFDDEV